jgi:dynein heavy chain
MSLFKAYESGVQKVGDPRMPRFLMRISCSKSTVIEYDPPVSELYEVIEAGLGFVLHTMESLPRPEFILYGPLRDQLFMDDIQKEVNKEAEFSFVNAGGPEIKVLFETKEAEFASQKLKNVASVCFGKVQLHLKKYDHYLKLFSKEIEDEVVAFVNQDHSFEEYAEVISYIFNKKQIEKYRGLAVEINSLPRRIEFPLIEINADEFHRQLTARALELSNMLLRRIIQQNLEFEKTYVFKKINN